jgi:hypothetical protein
MEPGMPRYKICNTIRNNYGTMWSNFETTKKKPSEGLRLHLPDGSKSTTIHKRVQCKVMKKNRATMPVVV